MCLGAFVCLRSCVCACTHIHTRTHTHTNTHTPAGTHTRSHTRTHFHPHTHNKGSNIKGGGTYQQRWDTLPSTFVGFLLSHTETHTRTKCLLYTFTSWLRILSSSHEILAGLPRRIFTSLPQPTFVRACAYTEKLGCLAKLECMRKCVYVCGLVCVCLRACLCASVCVGVRACV